MITFIIIAFCLVNHLILQTVSVECLLKMRIRSPFGFIIPI